MTIRRWGWSDVSELDAQRMADSRADSALVAAELDPAVVRRERRVPYNGADGVPIREEILERVGDIVFTRNVYGAECLNVEDVFFADLDFDVFEEVSFPLHLAAILAGLGAGVGIASAFAAGAPFPLAVVVGLAAAGVATALSRALARFVRGGPSAVAQRLVERFVRENPSWKLRVYATPAGMRLAALHQRFDPAGEQATRAFAELRCDPRFAAMCRLQRCFRARTTPKPWRIGMDERLHPHSGAWPFDPSYAQRRAEWVATYRARADAFAACRWVADVGDGSVDPDVERVVALHDQRSGARSGRPIA